MNKVHFSRSQCLELMELIDNNDLKGCINFIDNNIKTGVSWIKESNKFKVFLNNLINDNYDYIPY